MEKNRIKNEDLALLVFRTLIKVLLENSQYFLFRCGIGVTSNKMVSFSKFSKERIENRTELHESTPFSNVETYHEIIDKMVIMANENGLQSLEGNEIQRIVLYHTNNLLHFCLEPFLKDFSLLEKIGKETFESVCKNVIGVDFVDTTPSENERIKNIISKLNNKEIRINNDFVRYMMEKINNNGGNLNLDWENILSVDLPF